MSAVLLYSQIALINDSRSDSRTPEESLSFNQRIEYVKSVMQKMPSTSRRVIQMRFFDDFTYEEMADELGFTLQQVKNAMHRTKRDLIELIELQAYDDVLHK